MSILKRWDDDYNSNNGIPWSEFVKTVDKSNYSPELFNDNGSGENAGDDEDLYPEDDNLYSDEEIANWEKERAGNKKSSEEVEFITVHPNGGEGHVIAIDDDKKVVSPDAGEFKGTTLSSAKSVELGELEKKSSEKSSKKGKSKSDDDDDEPAGVEKGTKEYYQAKVDKYEKRLKMYSMKMEELQKKIDSGDSSAAEELEKYKTRQARVEKKLAGYKKNLEKYPNGASKLSVDGPSYDTVVKASLTPNLSKSKSSKDTSSSSNSEVYSSDTLGASNSSESRVADSENKMEAIRLAIGMPNDSEYHEKVYRNIEKVNSSIEPFDKYDTPSSYKSAVTYYTKGDYRSFNSAIVGSNYEDVASKVNLLNAKRLDKMFSEPSCKTTDDVVLFRSMNSRHLPAGFFEGVPYVDNQIVSTSASHKFANMWKKSNKCELAIYLPKGSTAANISKLGVEAEEETLLPPNTAYRFIGVIGHRKSFSEKEPHPVYAVEAYTPKSINIRRSIEENRKLIDDIRNSGEMPNTFYKGVYDIAKQFSTKQTSFTDLVAQFGNIDESRVREYYNKYKDLFKGGEATPKGVHAGWEHNLAASESLKTSKKEPSISSSKSYTLGEKPKVLDSNKAAELDISEANPKKYSYKDFKNIVTAVLGAEKGKKWLDMFDGNTWLTIGAPDYISGASTALKKYLENPNDVMGVIAAQNNALKASNSKPL